MSDHVICLLTGANFLDPVNKRWIEGDLHQLFNTLILNANNMHWVDATKTPMPEDTVGMLCPVYYEKNFQIVFPLELCQFNQAAFLYLKEELAASKNQIVLLDQNSRH